MVTSEDGTRGALSTSRAQACRAQVIWLRYQLAAASGVPKRRLARCTSGDRAPQQLTSGDSAPQQRAIAEACAAFESAGVAFTSGTAPGIRLRRG